MANLVTLGLSAILGSDNELTDASKAFDETGYTKYGLTYKDTAQMNQEDGTETEFYAEEEDDAIETTTQPGKTTLSFSIMNPTLDALKRLLGGEVANEIWAYPDTVATVENSVIIKPNKGLMFHIARGKVKAKFNGSFAKSGLMLLEVTVTALKPNTDGVKKMYVKKITAA
jgi:hypothetical protein